MPTMLLILFISYIFKKMFYSVALHDLLSPCCFLIKFFMKSLCLHIIFAFPHGVNKHWLKVSWEKKKVPFNFTKMRVTRIMYHLQHQLPDHLLLSLPLCYQCKLSNVPQQDKSLWILSFPLKKIPVKLEEIFSHTRLHTLKQYLAWFEFLTEF